MHQKHYKFVKFLVDLESIKKGAREKPVISMSLTSCKMYIINSYMNSICDGVMAMLALHEDINAFPVGDDQKFEKFLNARLLYICNIFEHSFQNNIRSDLHKFKFLYFHQLYHNHFGEEVLKRLKLELYKYYIKRPPITDPNFINLFDSIVDNLHIIFEMVIIFLSGLRLNCNNISSEILTNDCYKNIHGYSDTCIHSKLCNLNTYTQLNKEIIHVVMMAEYRNGPRFFDKMIEVLITYHNNLRNVTLVYDHKLFSDFKWDEREFKYYQLAKEMFHDVIFINSENVDFGEYSNSIKMCHENVLFESRSYQKLGTILVSDGKITNSDINEMMDKRRAVFGNDATLGELLVQHGKVTKNDILQALQKQHESLLGQPHSNILLKD